MANPFLTLIWFWLIDLDWDSWFAIRTFLASMLIHFRLQGIPGYKLMASTEAGGAAPSPDNLAFQAIGWMLKIWLCNVYIYIYCMLYEITHYITFSSITYMRFISYFSNITSHLAWYFECRFVAETEWGTGVQGLPTSWWTFMVRQRPDATITCDFCTWDPWQSWILSLHTYIWSN